MCASLGSWRTPMHNGTSQCFLKASPWTIEDRNGTPGPQTSEALIQATTWREVDIVSCLIYQTSVWPFEVSGWLSTSCFAVLDSRRNSWKASWHHLVVKGDACNYEGFHKTPKALSGHPFWAGFSVPSTQNPLTCGSTWQNNPN